MTDKPMKNARKYVDSGFVHDMTDTKTADHYFVRAHVWPSMKTELPHNVVAVLSVKSGAVIHASCAPCRSSVLWLLFYFRSLAMLNSMVPFYRNHAQVKNVRGTKARRETKIPAVSPRPSYPPNEKEVQSPYLLISIQDHQCIVKLDLNILIALF